MSPDWVWGAFLAVVAVLFGILEGHALAAKVPGGTLSSRIQAWFHVGTVAGKFAFTTMILGFAAWFIPHIIL